jgi:hypothetical protein
MALRVATMSSSDRLQSPSPRSHLMRKLILLVLLVVAMALSLAILFKQKYDLPVFYLNLLADASLGLVAGLGARFVLRRRHGMLRGLAAVATLVIGLFVLGYFTDWLVGIGPPVFWRSRPDWSGLAQWAVGTGVSLLALLAWHRPLPRLVTPVERTGQQSQRKKPHWSPAAIIPHIRVPGRRSARSTSSVGHSNAKTRTRSSLVRAKTPAHNEILLRPKQGAARTAKPKSASHFRRKSHKSHVQLALIEEHRCPYCLEPVKRNDPRGVKECEVCHTLHHADCWAITGTCQVPHYNG